MKTYLHGTGLLLLALAGSALLMLLVFTLTSMLTIWNRPAAAYLPVESTLAVFHHPSHADLELYGVWFPKLRGLETEGVEAIALVQREQDRIPILFFRTEAQNPKEETVTLGSYHVTSPRGEILQWLATQTGSTLADSNTYDALRAGRTHGSSWIFIRKEAIPEATTLQAQLLQGFLLQDGTALAISEEEEGMRFIALYGGKNSPGAGPLPPLQVGTGALLTMQLHEGSSLWKSVQSYLTSDHSTQLSGLLQQLLYTGFGEGLSMEYDILPLLHRNLSISLQLSSSGTLLVALHATGKDTEELTLLTERLHEGTKWRLPTTSAATYVFDQRFSTKTMRTDTSRFTEELSVENGWEIHRTRATDATTGLFTAVRGNELLLANTETVLSSLLQSDGSSSVFYVDEKTPSANRMLGWADVSRLQPIVQKYLPALSGPTDLPLFQHITSSVLWSMDDTGPLKTMTVRGR